MDRLLRFGLFGLLVALLGLGFAWIATGFDDVSESHRLKLLVAATGVAFVPFLLDLLAELGSPAGEIGRKLGKLLLPTGAAVAALVVQQGSDPDVWEGFGFLMAGAIPAAILFGFLDRIGSSGAPVPTLRPQWNRPPDPVPSEKSGALRPQVNKPPEPSALWRAIRPQLGVEAAPPQPDTTPDREETTLVPSEAAVAPDSLEPEDDAGPEKPIAAKATFFDD